MFESECAGWKSRLHIEEGGGMSSYLGAFHFGCGAAASWRWNLLFGAAAFLSGPCVAFNCTGHFSRPIVVGATHHAV